MFIANFQSLEPKFHSPQKKALEWILASHMQSEEDEEKKEAFRQRLSKVGCSEEHIATRYHAVSDFHHTNWEEMDVYRLHENPEGSPLSMRMEFFDKEVNGVFDKFYEEETAPDDLIHVSCTGYVSPSGAQKIVSKKNWGSTTTVTHAYHMGCYGSIPAIRMARGFLAAEPQKSRADIVHTELCTLHSNPANHNSDQLVTQSLFSDGYIRYSMTKKKLGASFEVGPVKEEIIPNSSHLMTWSVSEWGFQMGLSKELPVYIKRFLKGFMERLGVQLDSNPLFAIHPGGPKIIQYTQDLFDLSESQVAHSKRMLFARGNMSSATLPHVWQSILNDPNVEEGKEIVSLAFGPGLSVCAGVLTKRCG